MTNRVFVSATSLKTFELDDADCTKWPRLGQAEVEPSSSYVLLVRSVLRIVVSTTLARAAAAAWKK
jgi:hypothetical protein